jgi:hypothetical protein
MSDSKGFTLVPSWRSVLECVKSVQAGLCVRCLSAMMFSCRHVRQDQGRQADSPAGAGRGPHGRFV